MITTFDIILNVNMKTKQLFGIFILFLLSISFSSCDKDKEDVNKITPEDLYQTSWRGTGYCGEWIVKERGIGIQFIDTKRGKVNWQNYYEFDITYTMEGKYITFNNIAFQLGGAPWVIKSYTKTHMTLVQNEASPGKEKIATIELDRVN